MRHPSKMKCEACNEHPAWHRALDWADKPTLVCGLCGHFQRPRVTAAKRARVAAERAQCNATATWLDQWLEGCSP